MKKTMNINIAGQLFRVDEDAWEILKRYLDHVAARFRSEQGGEETLADIESRIAEIFGGGNESPTLVSKEMVNDMINIMGAPEDYYDSAVTTGEGKAYPRKSMYDPNSLSARVGKFLSEFFTAVGKVLSAILRVMAVILGTFFTITGFTLLFMSVLVLFFSSAPFVASVLEPEMIHPHTMLSLVINGSSPWLIILLSALVVILPLSALTYLGIRLIFRIRENSRVFGLVMFVTWIASACALGVLLALQLSVYSSSENVEERVNLETPARTVWIAPMRTAAGLNYDRGASVDHFSLWVNTKEDRMYGSVDLNISGSDTTSGWISVERRASSKSESEAWSRAKSIEYNWKFSGDTLYLDEFFTIPSGSRWNGSTVDVEVLLPEGTEVRAVDGSVFSQFGFRSSRPGLTSVRISEGYAQESDEL